MLVEELQLNPEPERRGRAGQAHGAQPFAFQTGLSAQGRAPAGCKVPGEASWRRQDVRTQDWDSGCSQEGTTMLEAAGSR